MHRPQATPGGWTWHAGSVLLTIAAVGTVLGAFLPWATLGFISVAGTDGDGVITLVLGVLAGVLGFVGVSRRSTGLLVGTLLAMVAVTLIALYDTGNVASMSNEFLGRGPDVGSGLILTVIAGFCGIAGSIVSLVKSNR